MRRKARYEGAKRYYEDLCRKCYLSSESQQKRAVGT